MFPYNDTENTWISKGVKTMEKPTKHSFIYSLFFALFMALLSTTISPLIYFLKTN